MSIETRRLGGLRVTVVGLGCNNFGRRVDLDGTRAVVDAALEVGVDFLDTADIYGSDAGASERLLGEALDTRRDEVAVATKFGMDMTARGAENVPDAPRGSREYVRWAIEGSLRRLRADAIDLYQYHEPDGVTPVAETLGAMSELVDEGKALYLGVSNFDAAQLREAHEAAGDLLVSVQNEYSLLKRGIEADVAPECERLGIGIIPFFPLASGLLTGKYRRGEPAPDGTRLHGRGEVADDETFDRLEALTRFAEERGIEADLAPECERLGIGIIPFFPLASGLLTGKYRRGEPAPEGTRLHGRGDVADDETFDRLEALTRFAEERGIEPIDAAIGGLAAQPAVASVIAGATKPEQVRRNARASEWKPSPDDLAELDRIFPPGR